MCSEAGAMRPVAKVECVLANGFSIYLLKKMLNLIFENFFRFFFFWFTGLLSILLAFPNQHQPTTCKSLLYHTYDNTMPTMWRENKINIFKFQIEMKNTIIFIKNILNCTYQQNTILFRNDSQTQVLLAEQCVVLC